jgi:ergothioneine biosynthesis protein EgtB
MTQSALIDHFLQVRAETLARVAPLSAEDCQVQSMPDASPAKWHLAHTTWFFETFVLERFEPGFEPHDPVFRTLFNSYYQALGPQHPRPERGLITRPGLAAVLAYRTAVDRRLLALLAHRPDSARDALVGLGCQHEQQHQELILTDVLHLLSLHPDRPGCAAEAPMPLAVAADLQWQQHEPGWTWIGHDPTTDGNFAFDNEGPRHRVFLQPYEIASRPVTQGEWLDFIADGGYRRPELWLSLGWDWVQAGRRDSPLYWQRSASDAPWSVFGLRGVLPLDRQAPVSQISWFEADAHARWAGARLPSEFEWEHAARSGLAQTGQVWEWTASPYSGYPRYQPAPGAVGEYNGKFMCNQFVLRGGSVATPAGHFRLTYRNFFPPAAQWQFSGLRLARDV